jgi:integrase
MTRRESPAPSLEQVRHVVFSMPATDAIERRGRALAAFILLTGVRDGAVASLELKHVDLVERCVSQDGREVATKFGKSFSTWFFPVGDDVRRIVAETKRAAGSPGPSSSNHDLRLARCRRATVGGSRCWRLRRAWTSVVRKLTWRTQ